MCAAYCRANPPPRRHVLKSGNRRISLTISTSRMGEAFSSGAPSGPSRSTVPPEQTRASERREVERGRGKASILKTILAVFAIVAILGMMGICNFSHATTIKNFTIQSGVKDLDVCCMFVGVEYSVGFSVIQKYTIVCGICETTPIRNKTMYHVLTNQMKM